MPSKSGDEIKTSHLDVYDEFLNNWLKSTLKQYRMNLKDIEPILKSCSQIAKSNVARTIEKSKISNITQIRHLLCNEAFGNIKIITSQINNKFDEIRNDIRKYRPFLIAGAGISDSSNLPLSKQLSPITDYSGAGSLGELARDKEKLQTFKTEFKKMCDKNKPTKAHCIIALNFPEFVREIVYLNWDNLLERSLNGFNKSYSKCNREDIAPSDNYVIWKFHGDVEFITCENNIGLGGWVLPQEDGNTSGYVFNSFEKHFEDSFLSRDLYVIIEIGYNREDKVINERIVERLSGNKKRPVYYTTMDMSERNIKEAMIGPADYVLKFIMPNLDFSKFKGNSECTSWAK